MQASVRTPPSCPRATSWQGTIETTKSDGGQFPSHPGRPGPETSSEGTHLTPNPQEIQAGFTPSMVPPTHPTPYHSTPPTSLPTTPRHPSIPPPLPCFSSEAEKPRKFKASVRARANPRAAFPRARADEILFFARKNYRGRGRAKTENKVKQTVRGRSRTRGDEG